ncbi:MAG: hypothetical protein Q7S06_01360 [Nanoarchaeota archaeon]|nr:hypothetical protein [Nanoarchaeota archaeon]
MIKVGSVLEEKDFKKSGYKRGFCLETTLRFPVPWLLKLQGTDAGSEHQVGDILVSTSFHINELSGNPPYYTEVRHSPPIDFNHSDKSTTWIHSLVDRYPREEYETADEALVGHEDLVSKIRRDYDGSVLLKRP